MVSSKDGFASASEIAISTISANDIIHQLKPAIIPRISSIANMAWCKRAAYDISFLGLESNYSPGSGDIGSSVHRIVIKSILEIVRSIKDDVRLSKSDATDIFLRNAREEIEINWKFYVLSGIEQPLPIIMQDLNIRADRLANQLTTRCDDSSPQKLILRPEFTIRNPKIPLEGRLDLLRIISEEPVPDSSKYLTADDLIDLNVESVDSTDKDWKGKAQNATDVPAV
jgi:hypothetical protein